MNLRSLILLGWEKTDKNGPDPVVNLYTGHDGIELQKAHAQAQASGKFIAFRKVINPSGIPLNAVADKQPDPPKEQKPETADPDDHPVGAAAKSAKTKTKN